MPPYLQPAESLRVGSRCNDFAVQRKINKTTTLKNATFIKTKNAVIQHITAFLCENASDFYVI